MPYFHHFVSDSPTTSLNGHSSTPYNSSANNGAAVANGAANQPSNVNGEKWKPYTTQIVYKVAGYKVAL